MDKAGSNLVFRLMTFGYKFRDLRLPRMNILKEVGIKPGFHVLDYGCGPGSYIVPLAELVGELGKVYALDIHPLAIRKVRDMAAKKGLANVETIFSYCQTGLPDNSLDVVVLYDVFHHLSDPTGVLKELHRVLKPDGILSFSDHHMKESEIVSRVTSSGLFKLSKKGQRTYSFLKK
ncbi:MAG: class I SAM-dependent methyltransferase [Dehalococcoidia bacterium]